MRGLDSRMSIGERVAWYRRRRGLSQAVLAGLVGRTVDWLSKVENGRAALDRVSVISQLADALDVSLGDLIGSPQLMDWNGDNRRRTVPALRRAVLGYTSLTPGLTKRPPVEPDLGRLRVEVDEVWNAYQAARFGYVTQRMPAVLAHANAAATGLPAEQQPSAAAQLALLYQAAATTLTKLGEVDLAWICSDRGFEAAERSKNLIVIGSLLRSVAHSLLSNGQHNEALAVVETGAARLTPGLARASKAYLSVYGSLFLAGAMAAARIDDPRAARELLRGADVAADRLGKDANHVWSAFGPTNVAIHRTSVAMECGEVSVAVDLGPRIDATGLPVERRVRHALEVARAYTAYNRPGEGLRVLLGAERDAPEQVRYHFLSRQLVIGWMRRTRTKPTIELQRLAQRLHVA